MYPLPLPELEMDVPTLDDFIDTGKTLIRHLDMFIPLVEVRAKAENRNQNRHNVAKDTFGFRLSLVLAMALLSILGMPQWLTAFTLMLSGLAMFFAIKGYYRVWKAFFAATQLLVKDDEEIAKVWLSIKLAHYAYTQTISSIGDFVEIQARTPDGHNQHPILIAKLANILARQKDSDIMNMTSAAALEILTSPFRTPVTERLQDLKENTLTIVEILRECRQIIDDDEGSLNNVCAY